MILNCLLCRFGVGRIELAVPDSATVPGPVYRGAGAEGRGVAGQATLQHRGRNQGHPDQRAPPLYGCRHYQVSSTTKT